MCRVTILTSEWRECTRKVHDYVMAELQFYRDSDRPGSNPVLLCPNKSSLSNTTTTLQTFTFGGNRELDQCVKSEQQDVFKDVQSFALF